MYYEHDIGKIKFQLYEKNKFVSETLCIIKCVQCTYIGATCKGEL